jgi:hypothetical protein
MSIRREPAEPRVHNSAPKGSQVEDFTESIIAIAEQHRPSRMPFFAHLAALPRDRATDPLLLGQVHLNYQAAMHATRAAVYHLPHLDSPGLRKRKLHIFVDDDGLPDGDTHHYQLTRVFHNIGAVLMLGDEEFGEPAELWRRLEDETAHFVRFAPQLYARSLGAWCVVELLSVSWMRAFADALTIHFPTVKDEPYFADCFAAMVEERHAAEALEVTRTVIEARPELLADTLRDAAIMARALDGVWVHLDRIIVGTGTDFGPDATAA